LLLWKEKINAEINASVDLWSYYSEMERKENHRRLMAACVRKVYDNDKKDYTPWPEAP